MTVEVVDEPKEFAKEPAEHCCVCNDPTRTWFKEKDVALCRQCAEDIDEKDVPSKEEWFKAWRERNEGFLARQMRRNILT